MYFTNLRVCRCLHVRFLFQWLWALSSLGSCRPGKGKVNKEPSQPFIPHSGLGFWSPAGWCGPALCLIKAAKLLKDAKNTCVGGVEGKGMRRSARQGLWLLLGGLAETSHLFPAIHTLLFPSVFLCTVQGKPVYQWPSSGSIHQGTWPILSETALS